MSAAFHLSCKDSTLLESNSFLRTLSCVGVGLRGRVPCLFSRPMSIPVLPKLQMEGTGLLLSPELGGGADAPSSDLPEDSGA